MSLSNEKADNAVQVEHDEDSVVKPFEHENAGSMDSVLQQERHLSLLQSAKLHWRPLLCCR